MKNKAGIVSGIAGIITVILAMVLLFNSFEHQEEADQKLQESKAELDRIVNRAVEFCEGKSSEECDQLMLEWFEECKKPEMKMISSCLDGRITNYLVINGLVESSSSKIQENIDNSKELMFPIKSEQIEKFNKATLNLLSACDEVRQISNDVIAEYGPDSEEFKAILEWYKPKQDECNQSIESIKNLCEQQRGTTEYPEVCDDPRLS
ncbi:MAG: hypothetical protein ACREAL_07810 [Nitrosopumilaceae archaeon]